MKKIIKKTNNKKEDKFQRVQYLHVNILCSDNNTIVTITKKNGDTLMWSTCSSAGFKGAKKSNANSAQKMSEFIGKKIFNLGIKNINIFIKGIGYGREPSIKGFYNSGLKINTIADNTPIPHNGCKGKKLRRL